MRGRWGWLLIVFTSACALAACGSGAKSHQASRVPPTTVAEPTTTTVSGPVNAIEKVGYGSDRPTVEPIPQPTTLPAPPATVTPAPLLGTKTNAVVDWAVGTVADGLSIVTLDLDTGRYSVRPGPIGSVQGDVYTNQTPEDPSLNPESVLLARLANGLLAVTDFETRWYPNNGGESVAIARGSNTAYSVQVFVDRVTGDGVVARGTGPYELVVVDGKSGRVKERRVVGFENLKLAKQIPGDLYYWPVAADSGLIYLTTDISDTHARAIRFDPATGRATWLSRRKGESFSGADNGFQIYKALPESGRGISLVRADGTVVNGEVPLDAGCCGGTNVSVDGHDVMFTDTTRAGTDLTYVDVTTGEEVAMAKGAGASLAYSWALATGWILSYSNAGLVALKPGVGPLASRRLNVGAISSPANGMLLGITAGVAPSS